MPKAIYTSVKNIGVRANLGCLGQSLLNPGVGQRVTGRSIGNRPAFIRSQSVTITRALQMEVNVVSDFVL